VYESTVTMYAHCKQTIIGYDSTGSRSGLSELNGASGLWLMEDLSLWNLERAKRTEWTPEEYVEQIALLAIKELHEFASIPMQ